MTTPANPGNPNVPQWQAPPATIVQGTVTANAPDAVDDGGKIISEGSALTTDYVINNRYEGDQHVYMAGVASPGGFNGQSAAFFQLAAPTLMWISDWTACRGGVMPVVPDPVSKNANWVLLDVWYEPADIGLLQDGETPLYRISGTYFYGHVNPDANTVNNINYGVPPWLDASSFPQTIGPDKVQKGIIDGSAVTVVNTPPGQSSQSSRPGFFVQNP